MINKVRLDPLSAGLFNLPYLIRILIPLEINYFSGNFTILSRVDQQLEVGNVSLDEVWRGEDSLPNL